MSLLVYKSSAGSGKTSTLVIEYLALALKKPRQFRQIIALTFTIKATSEMKERLLEYLLYLQKMDIDNIDNSYKHIVEKLEEITGFEKQQIKNNSKILLNRILHNYGDFGFNTIDSFVIGIVRSFAHDLQLSTKFEIELNKSDIINEALNKFYELIGNDKNITNFLVDFVINQLDDERSADLDKPLTELAKLTFESKHYANIENLKNLNLENFVEIKKIIQKEIKDFEQKISDLGQEGIDCIEKHNLKAGDCSRKWLYNYFFYLKSGHKNAFDIDELEKTTFLNMVENDSNWYAKSQKSNIKELIDEAKPELLEIISKARNYHHKALPYYNTYKLLQQKITPLALIHILKEIIYNNSIENDIVHISEANRKISEVIKDQHAPYIYERIGHQYSNYLIDEFQDTSVIQWNNVLPLIDNSLANGKKCLLVGDAKQSIYRWRDGDVEQFVNLPKLKGDGDQRLLAERQNLLENTIIFKNLDTNYRSLKNIIDFNNTLFEHLLQFEGKYVNKVFVDFYQNTPKTKDEGYVKLKNFVNDDDNEELLAEILQQIYELVDNQAYDYSDICILARKKKDLAMIADFLITNGIKIMSSDALMLNKSKEVSFIISMLNIVEGIDVSINSYIAINYLYDYELVSQKTTFKNSSDFFKYLKHEGLDIELAELRQLTIIEALEKIISTSLPINSKDSFIYRLLDVVLEQSNKIGNSISAFIDYWNDNNSSLSINIPETNNAVRLSTVHSAKGLEFPVVIFPAISLDESLNGKDYLWINAPETISNIAPTLIVGNESKGLRSSEKIVFEEEVNRQSLDKLNLFYVACTRPTEQLYIYFSSKENAKKEKDKGMWNTQIASLPTVNQIIENRDENEIVIGNPIKHKIKNNNIKNQNTNIHTYIYEDWRNKIQIKTNYRPNEIEIKKEKGIQLHYLLNKLSTKTDITSLVTESITNKNLSLEYKKEFTSLLEELINNSETNIFFNNEDIYKGEKEILTQNNKTYRPDKVIYKNDEIWIVDYKYADKSKISKNEINNHKKQVKKYMSLIQQIEGKKTKGFLLYLQGLTRIFDLNQ
jgi:ATP-dependent exoDNAse (exonuclease V) beta subunit